MSEVSVEKWGGSQFFKMLSEFNHLQDKQLFDYWMNHHDVAFSQKGYIKDCYELVMLLLLLTILHTDKADSKEKTNKQTKTPKSC